VLAIVPVKGLDGAKSRLAPRLSPGERADLVREMLERVLAACGDAAAITRTLVVTPEPDLAPPGFETLVDGGTGHPAAIALALRDPRARAGALVVMADCPLATAEALDELARAARPVALVRSRDGGVNALALREPGLFEPAFGRPAEETIRRCRAAGLEPALVADERLEFEVDRPEDYDLLLACL
jgi:2-phospho-L-lactate/phosphoenolpyruvate guanylyltransferase